MEFFKNMCQQWNLGRIITEPFPLQGGLMHKMYGICTDRGKYAVKILNPHVMLRKTAKENFSTAERLESLLEKEGIPILPALIYYNRKMQELDGQYFYLFDWYDGKAVHGGEIHQKHCAEMGKALARIHQIDQRDSGGEKVPLQVNWSFYYKEMKNTDKEIFDLLERNLSFLYEFQERGNRASIRVPGVSTICHNDMDSKNVLWQEAEYRIIDLECLSYSNPLEELLETALCWAGFDDCNFSMEKFQSFTEAYAEQNGGLLENVSWESVYDSNNGQLLWLEYNLKRVLGIECEESEKEIGKSETVKALERIAYYDKMREIILNGVV